MLDAALLVYRIAFSIPGCEEAVFDVRAENTRPLGFYRSFGAVKTGTDGINVYFKLRSDDFIEIAPYLDAVFRSFDQE